jgi:ribonuclease P protein component
LAATDETNLSTPQPATQTHTWLSGTDGDGRGPQCAETAASQGPQAACDNDTAETTRLSRQTWSQRRLTFKNHDRLHRRSEFQYIQRHGAQARTNHFVVYAGSLPNASAIRLGISVSRRLGNAVKRNRIKRTIRECFRLKLRSRFPTGTGVVIIRRADAATLATKSVMRELDIAVTNLRLRLTEGHE